MNYFIILILLVVIICCILISDGKKIIIQEDFSLLNTDKDTNTENYKQVVVQLAKPIYNTMTIVTLDKGELYYNYSATLAKIFPIKVVEGLGSLDNVKKVISNKANFAVAQEDVLVDAILGKGDFKKRHKNLALISSIFEEKVALIVNPTKNITGWNDLKGKTVCFGKQGSGSLYNGLELCRLIGISKSDLNIIYGGQYSDNILNKVKTDQIDALYITGEHPDRAIKELLRIKLLRIIGTNGIPNKFIETRFPTWNKSSIDVRDYKIPSVVIKIPTYATKTVILSKKNTDYVTIYNMVNALFSNTLYIRNNLEFDEHKIVLESYPISRAFQKHNIIPLHPAVKDYYKDIGMITNDSNPKCALFAGSSDECKLEILNPYTGY